MFEYSMIEWRGMQNHLCVFHYTFCAGKSNNFPFWFSSKPKREKKEPREWNENATKRHVTGRVDVQKCSLFSRHVKFIFHFGIECNAQLTVSLRVWTLSLYAFHTIWVFHKFHKNVLEWCRILLCLCIINAKNTIQELLFCGEIIRHTKRIQSKCCDFSMIRRVANNTFSNFYMVNFLCTTQNSCKLSNEIRK